MSQTRGFIVRKTVVYTVMYRTFYMPQVDCLYNALIKPSLHNNITTVAYYYVYNCCYIVV